MKIDKNKILKILSADGLSPEKQSELLLLLMNNADLLTELVSDNIKAKPKPKAAKAAKPKAGTKTDLVRDFIKKQKKGYEFNIDTVHMQTGLSKKDARSTVYRLYRHGELKSKNIGLYYK